MIRIALAVILVLGAAFAYREVTKPSLHDQAVASLKQRIGETGADPASVSCNAKPSPISPGYAGYGNVTLFDCSYTDPTGAVLHTCMLHGGNLAHISNGWATDAGDPAPRPCAAGPMTLATVLPSMPTLNGSSSGGSVIPPPSLT
jgi:hypothetical protein